LAKKVIYLEKEI